MKRNILRNMKKDNYKIYSNRKKRIDNRYNEICLNNNCKINNNEGTKISNFNYMKKDLNYNKQNIIKV